MDYFSFTRHHLSLLTCPRCIPTDDYSTLYFTAQSGHLYFTCSRCEAFYPFKYVPYISSICSPANCGHECMSACRFGAIVQAENGRVSIKYEQCRFCSHCVCACPLKAVVCFLTPFFSIPEPFSGKGGIPTILTNEEGITFYHSSSTQTVLFCPAVLLYHLEPTRDRGVGDYCYRYLKRNLPLGSIVFDALCGDNGFKAFYEEFPGTSAVLSADVNLLREEDWRKYYCPVAFVYDERALPLLSDTFDVVLVNCSVPFVLEPHVFLVELNRILKKEGRLFIVVPRWKKERNWKDLFTKAGFQVLEDEVIRKIFPLVYKIAFMKRFIFSSTFSNPARVYVLAKHERTL